MLLFVAIKKGPGGAGTLFCNWFYIFLVITKESRPSPRKRSKRKSSKSKNRNDAVTLLLF